MPRRNLDNDYWGESPRVTIRLSRTDWVALGVLEEDWGLERSGLIRRALREAASKVRKQRREAIEASLLTMRVPRLRKLAGDYGIRGRSKMPKADLIKAIRRALYSENPPLA